MRPDDPRHGTNAGATQHSADGEPPCDACRRAKRRYDKRVTHERHNGNPREVRLGEVAHRIVMHATTGHMAKLTGLHRELVRQVRRNGPDAMVFRSTRDAILDAAPAAKWTCIGIQRRLQGLVAAGWTARAIAQQARAAEPSIQRILATDRPERIRAEVAVKIYAATQALEKQQPPTGTPHQAAAATKARRWAEREGWLPLAMWDDIDDPNESPLVAPVRQIDIKDRLAEYDWLVSLGESEHLAARRIGMTAQSVRDQRSRVRRRAS